MCGFTGIIKQNHLLSDDEFTAMLTNMSARIKHRGPDDSGVWSDVVAGIGFAHRRLAVLDLSEAGKQPMVSISGRFIMVYNGEVYNFQELRKILENEGFYIWRGYSDTEVILAAIEYWGVRKTLDKLIGMFAFALWDRKDRNLYLARDRMGEKPLYYGYNNNTLFFGSDLASFAKSSFWSPELNHNALGLFLKYGYIPAPLSIYKNMYKLPPGTYIRLGLNKLNDSRSNLPEPTPYWSFTDTIEHGRNHPFSGNSNEVLEELERLLDQSVNMQKIADVPLGTFLSGGIDSSLVTAVLQNNSTQPVKTFSIGFKEKEYNEAHHAKKIASHLHTDHTELYVTAENVMSVIPDLPAIYSEPFADVSQLPTVLVSRLARQQVTVCLSGDGGDELFYGYSRYIKDPARWQQISHIPHLARKVISSIIEKTPHSIFDALLLWGKLYRNPDMKQGSLTSSVKKLGKEMTLNNFGQLYDFRMSGWWEPETIVRHYRSSSLFANCHNTKKNSTLMTILDTLMYLPDDILVKVDRAAMSASLETRVPLLDHRLVEFSTHLPLSIKLKDVQQKWPLKQILYKYIPQEFFDRPKMGFGVPVGAWLRGPLREWAEDLLNEKRLQRNSSLVPEPIRKIWADHLAGTHNRQTALWNVLMFLAWQKHYKI